MVKQCVLSNRYGCRSGKLVILVAFKERDIHGYALVITSNTASQLEPDGDILMDDIDGAQLIEDIIRLDYADVSFNAVLHIFRSHRLKHYVPI